MKSLFFAVVLTLVLPLCGSSVPFEWKAEIRENKLYLTAKVAPGYYFYRNTLVFDIGGKNNAPLLPQSLPPAQVIADDMFGKVEIYPSGTWNWIFESNEPFVKCSITYQGCRKAQGDEAAMCFMPQTVSLLPGVPEVTDAAALASEHALADTLKNFAPAGKIEGLQSEKEFSGWLRQTLGESEKYEKTLPTVPDTGFLALILLALLGGLGLNLTPCVLPMIPITLAVIGAGKNSGKQGFFQGCFYGLGMTLAYGVLGMAVILAGARFGELQSSMYFNFAAALIFLMLGLAAVGVFNIDFSRASSRVKASRIPGGRQCAAFVMGAVGAVLAGACVAPVVISVLLFASDRYHAGNFAALFLPLVLGLGMALPWPFAGAGLAVLPRPGKFMLYIKYLFAVFIFGAALWYAFLGWRLRPGVWDAEKELLTLQSALAGTEKKFVLIDFKASWCKNCSAMEKVLAAPAVSAALEKVEVLPFQAEDPSAPGVKELLDQYGISGFPAFVMLEKRP